MTGGKITKYVSNELWGEIRFATEIEYVCRQRSGTFPSRENAQRAIFSTSDWERQVFQPSVFPITTRRLAYAGKFVDNLSENDQIYERRESTKTRVEFAIDSLDCERAECL